MDQVWTGNLLLRDSEPIPVRVVVAGRASLTAERAEQAGIVPGADLILFVVPRSISNDDDVHLETDRVTRLSITRCLGGGDGYTVCAWSTPGRGEVDG